MPCRVRTLFTIVTAVAIASCCGCQVDARVTVTAERSGSGTVNVRAVLDREAAGQLGDTATAFRFDDLRAAGWQIDAPVTSPGGVSLNASKRFESPSELPGVLDEVGGRGGVFRGWALHVDDGFASTSYAINGTVHLTGGLEQFSDADVATALDGLPLGRTPEELATALGPKRDRVKLTVVAALPGSVETESLFTIGDGTASDRVISADTEFTDGAPVRWMILAGACLFVAAALVVVPRRRRT